MFRRSHRFRTWPPRSALLLAVDISIDLVEGNTLEFIAFYSVRAKKTPDAKDLTAKGSVLKFRGSELTWIA
jgi:hypothetical protein